MDSNPSASGSRDGPKMYGCSSVLTISSLQFWGSGVGLSPSAYKKPPTTERLGGRLASVRGKLPSPRWTSALPFGPFPRCSLSAASPLPQRRHLLFRRWGCSVQKHPLRPCTFPLRPSSCPSSGLGACSPWTSRRAGIESLAQSAPGRQPFSATPFVHDKNMLLGWSPILTVGWPSWERGA